MHWHSMSIGEVLKKFLVTAEQGLSSKDISIRQTKYGRNVLVGKKKPRLVQKFFAQFADFMIVILIFAAVISFVVSCLEGSPNYFEPTIILAIIILNASLGLMQEAKAEKALEALKNLSAPSAHVLRDGMVSIIDTAELVPGDIIMLETGSYVPADARLISSVNLKVEEASLTGESHPVDKEAHVRLHIDVNLADRINMVMASSTITYGRGVAVVVETGMNTQVGHIANLIMKDQSPSTPLQNKLAQTSKILGIGALIICVIIFVMGIARKMPIFDMFMTSVSLAVAAIPEGLPAIVTIMLSLGVQRMAKKNAVIRKLPAVETLGSATVICSDKTGTLTQNLMTVKEIASLSGKEKQSSDFSNFLLSHASLCCDAQLQLNKKQVDIIGEPTEKALVMAAYESGINKNKLEKSYKRIHEIPFDSTRKLMTTVHKSHDNSYRSITKGAYDALLPKCNNYYHNGKQHPLERNQINKINALNSSMTKKALRVIAVAYRNIPKGHSKADEFFLENDLTFVGLVGMIDPPRSGVTEAVALCKEAGIKPVMITGDHVLTATAIAEELGILTNKKEAITGDELSRMSEEEFKKNISSYSVFARVTPEHKVNIVKALQDQGEIVAMTGDGVNDAPALKVANIGCAMGITGTDVAKNAADMILTDDNFSTIVAAVKEGRGIYENIKKAVHFLLSSNVGEILTIFSAILLGLPTPLVAVQLLWVNLVTDSLPAISLGVEAAEDDIMHRKPISPKKGMFADGLAIKIIIEGIMIGSLALMAFVVGYKFFDVPGGSRIPWVGRTMAFSVLSLSQLFHSFNMRSDHSLAEIGMFSNSKLTISFIICGIMQIAVVSLPTLAKVFQVVPLDKRQWAYVLLLSIVPILVVELQKKLNKSMKK